MMIIKMNNWQPIETAPKDGRLILAYGLWEGEVNGVGEMQIAVVKANNVYYPIVGADVYAAWLSEPTHWMPLPEPPIEL